MTDGCAGLGCPRRSPNSTRGIQPVTSQDSLREATGRAWGISQILRLWMVPGAPQDAEPPVSKALGGRPRPPPLPRPSPVWDFRSYSLSVPMCQGGHLGRGGGHRAVRSVSTQSHAEQSVSTRHAAGGNGPPACAHSRRNGRAQLGSAGAARPRHSPAISPQPEPPGSGEAWRPVVGDSWGSGQRVLACRVWLRRTRGKPAAGDGDLWSPGLRPRGRGSTRGPRARAAESPGHRACAGGLEAPALGPCESCPCSPEGPGRVSAGQAHPGPSSLPSLGARWHGDTVRSLPPALEPRA